MPTPATLVETSPGVWVADTDPQATPSGWIVDLGGGQYAVDTEAVGGPPVFVGDDESVYIETVIFSSGGGRGGGGLGGSGGGGTLGGGKSGVKGHQSPFTFARKK